MFFFWLVFSALLLILHVVCSTAGCLLYVNALLIIKSNYYRMNMVLHKLRRLVGLVENVLKLFTVLYWL